MKKIFSFSVFFAGSLSFVLGVLIAMTNEAQGVPDGFPMDPVFLFVVIGIAGVIAGMLIWPYPEGLKKYLKSIL